MRRFLRVTGIVTALAVAMLAMPTEVFRYVIIELTLEIIKSKVLKLPVKPPVPTRGS
jgi:hypothetical protein